MADLLRLLGWALVGIVDMGAATALGGLGCGAVVALAAGWVCAQHDSNYQRVRGLR